MNRMTVEMSIDVTLSNEEYDSFELFCNQLNIDYDEGFKKLIQIHLLTTEINTRYLEKDEDDSDGLSAIEKRLAIAERMIDCLVRVNEALQEKIATIEDAIDSLPTKGDINYLEQSIDEVAKDLDNLSAEIENK